MPGLKATPDYAQRSQNIHPFDLDRSGITDESVTKEDLQLSLQQEIGSLSSLSANVADVQTQILTTSVLNYTALTSDDTIIAQTVSGDVILSLPSSTSFHDAHIFNIKKEGNVGLVKVIPNGVETIDGSLTAFITTNNTCLTIQTDNISKWRII